MENRACSRATFWKWGLGGVGWDKNFHVTCVHTWCYAAATSVVEGWVGWGGIKTFMWLAYRRDALKCVLTTHKHGRKSILVTNGAPCYPKLTSENNPTHESCNHSKGIFCIKNKKGMVPCLCTPVVSMVCGKLPKVQYQVLGAHTKVVLLTLSCFKEFEFGNGDGTMEITKTSSVSPATL